MGGRRLDAAMGGSGGGRKKPRPASRPRPELRAGSLVIAGCVPRGGGQSVLTEEQSFAVSSRVPGTAAGAAGAPFPHVVLRNHQGCVPATELGHLCRRGTRRRTESPARTGPPPRCCDQKGRRSLRGGPARSSSAKGPGNLSGSVFPEQVCFTQVRVVLGLVGARVKPLFHLGLLLSVLGAWPGRPQASW